MKKKYLIFLLLLSFPLYTRADKTLDSLLNVLDLTIQEHETYVVQRESRIKHLKELTHGIESNSAEQYNLNSQIYKEYKAFICDSAIHYLNENIRIAERLRDTDRKIESQLQLSLLLSSTGMYKESLDVLESVDRRKIIPRLIADYYTCFDHVYGELGVYTQDKTLSGRYWSISQAYRDSLYAILPPESEEYLLMREASFRDQRQYEDALKVNDLRLTKIEPYTPQYAMATYHRSLIYKVMIVWERNGIFVFLLYRIFVLPLRTMLRCGCLPNYFMKMVIWNVHTNICAFPGMRQSCVVGRVLTCFH